jgi:plastocyanin
MKRILAVAFIVFPLAGAGCSSGTTTSSSTTPPAVQATGNIVEAVDFAFKPVTIAVKVGDAVTWNFTGAQPHNVVADDKSFESGTKNKDETFTHTFNAAGTFKYKCTIHPNMTGTVTVA